ncbi:Crp/Fnr family transcriptional regulator [Actinoplanes sp. CA-030573]|uniref:Crp/Fnr family transcriptional regulator n=1 Tax=Actinoplanes sp. CA-030573 TaxID=3239898 RepID=UPI003D944678
MRTDRSTLDSAFEAAGDRRRLGDGQELYGEGSAPGEVFLVRDGRLVLYRGGPDGGDVRVGGKRPGDLVGEAAALDDYPGRSRPVQAARSPSTRCRPACSATSSSAIRAPATRWRCGWRAPCGGGRAHRGGTDARADLAAPSV